MCRFIFLLIIVIAIILGIGAIFGSDVLMWVLIIGIAVPGLGLVLVPRRGYQFAYQNWYKKVALILLLVFIGIVAVFVTMLIVFDISSEQFSFVIAIFLAALLIGTYWLGWQIGPTTKRRRWLKKNFPAVEKAIDRYRKRGEILEDLIPALVIDNQRIFLIATYEPGNRESPSGLLLIDESGSPIMEKELFAKAIQCKSLAVKTIDFRRFNEKIGIIQNAQASVEGLNQVLDILRKEIPQITNIDSTVGKDIEKLIATKEPIHLFAQATIDIQLLEAKWGKEKSLGKLTEVSYDQVSWLIDEIEKIRKESVKRYGEIAGAVEPALRLIKVLEGIQYRIPQKDQVIEGLLGIADIGRGVIGHEKFEYALPEEGDWQAWRDRMEWARKVDAGLVEAGT